MEILQGNKLLTQEYPDTPYHQYTTSFYFGAVTWMSQLVKQLQTTTAKISRGFLIPGPPRAYILVNSLEFLLLV